MEVTLGVVVDALHFIFWGPYAYRRTSTGLSFT